MTMPSGPEDYIRLHASAGSSATSLRSVPADPPPESRPIAAAIDANDDAELQIVADPGLSNVVGQYVISK